MRHTVIMGNHICDDYSSRGSAKSTNYNTQKEGTSEEPKILVALSYDYCSLE